MSLRIASFIAGLAAAFATAPHADTVVVTADRTAFVMKSGEVVRSTR